MKLILSRKGFDSSAGGVPSPILADGRLLSLPIPDPHSNTRYGDIRWHGGRLGDLVTELTRGKITARHGAHLDPDVLPSSLPRARGWRPLFGQFGAAQSHLRNEGVGAGDLFLFFGLFRPRSANASPRHVLWGWFQIDRSVPESEFKRLPWAAQHPHIERPDTPGNTLYIARRNLTINGAETALPGAGVFSHDHPALHLTAPKAQSVSQWRLPGWFYPSKNRLPLSYHRRLDRWRRAGPWAYLQAAARGQEFVLDCAQYPPATAWAHELITCHGRQTH